MRLIKIISGLYGHRRSGKGRPEPMNSSSPPFSVEDREAARLVALKVAAYMDEPEDEMNDALDPDGLDKDDPDNGTGDDDLNIPRYNMSMSVAELKALMEECGLEVKSSMTKAAMVEALDAIFSDDEIEDFDAQEPVV